MISDIKNRIFFNLRNKLQLSRKSYKPPYEQKNNLHLEDYKYLFNKYNLTNLESKYSQSLFNIQLYHLQLLDKFINHFLTKQTCLHILDAGCDNWHYLPSLWFWAKSICDNIRIDGIELDAWKMYINGHTKVSFALGIISEYANVNYIHGNVLNYHQSPNFIFSSLPFIENTEAKHWHLPKKYFKPQQYLQHLWDILTPNGLLMVINVDEEEWLIQKNLFQKLNINLLIAGEPFVSNLCPYPSIRHISIAKKL